MLATEEPASRSAGAPGDDEAEAVETTKYIIIKNAAKCAHCGTIVESHNVMHPTYCRCKKISVRGGLLFLGRGWTKEMEDIIELGVMIPAPLEEEEEDGED